VALARAVYRDADVYLLDDPLSAVDAHVGQWLFKECLLGQLRGKTRVLVTHQVHLLDQCDLVVVLQDGAVRACGTFAELAGLDLEDIIGTTKEVEVEDEKLAVIEEEEFEEAVEEAVAEMVSFGGKSLDTNEEDGEEAFTYLPGKNGVFALS
jgi:ABC-type multidrug transport system ATPase subunit